MNRRIAKKIFAISFIVNLFGSYIALSGAINYWINSFARSIFFGPFFLLAFPFMPSASDDVWWFWLVAAIFTLLFWPIVLTASYAIYEQVRYRPSSDL